MMQLSPTDAIAKILTTHIPRDLIQAVDEALVIGAQRAFVAAKDMHSGHVANALGQMRHFHMNETFFQALGSGNATPSPIRGNGVVVGTSGIVAISRFNTSTSVWNTARRSATRRDLARANCAIQTLVQTDLFGDPPLITEVTAFFVSSFSGSLKIQPEMPICIEIAVPDRQLKGWLFREQVDRFLMRYDIQPAQIDAATPRLKSKVVRNPGES
jgi:hypothetical protein